MPSRIQRTTHAHSYTLHTRHLRHTVSRFTLYLFNFRRLSAVCLLLYAVCPCTIHYRYSRSARAAHTRAATLQRAFFVIYRSFIMKRKTPRPSQITVGLSNDNTTQQHGDTRHARARALAYIAPRARAWACVLCVRRVCLRLLSCAPACCWCRRNFIRLTLYTLQIQIDDDTCSGGSAHNAHIS